MRWNAERVSNVQEPSDFFECQKCGECCKGFGGIFITRKELTVIARHLGLTEDDFYRDYFLDIFDMMHDEDYTIADYPRVSFGPGQRYASKGCFVVRLGPGKTPELAPVSEWVIH